MPERSFPSEDLLEALVTARLEADVTCRGLLLAVARKLAGSDEDGVELFQQTPLNYHDTIQRNGFNGDRCEFYLLRTLRRTHHRSVFVRGRDGRQDGGHEIPFDFSSIECFSELGQPAHVY